MKIRPLLAVAALALAASAAHAQQIPPGSYQNSCKNIRVTGNNLTATCPTSVPGAWKNSLLFLPCNGAIYSDQRGNLTCNGVPGPAWSPVANYMAFTINGSGAISAGPVAAESCDRSCTLLLYAAPSVKFTAVPVPGNSVFTGWGGDCQGTAGDCYLDSTMPHRLTANFRLLPHTLTVAPPVHGAIVDAATGGSVVRCSSADRNLCSVVFDPGARIVLSAVAEKGFVLSGWSGDCWVAADLSCVATMSADHRASATFQQAGSNMTLIVSVSGAGVVRIGQSDCASNCTLQMDPKRVASLVASPNNSDAHRDTRFDSWGGDCSGANPRCNLDMSAPRRVYAFFKSFYHY